MYLRFAGKELLVTSAVANMAVASMFIGSLDVRYLASSKVAPDWPERVVRSLRPAIQADGTAQPPDR